VRLLLLKTGALGDVLRTTSVLPGLRALHPDLSVTWLTAPGAVPLVRHHPLVAEVHTVVADEPASVEEVARALEAEPWDRLLSLDDEEPLCALAARVAAASGARLTGATLAPDGSRTYTEDSAPWFDMGLLSRFGKEEADRLKVLNRESQPAIYARMLGIEMGEPELPVDPSDLGRARERAEAEGWHEGGPLIGMNTGAGGRWESKKLPVERVAELMLELDRRLERPGFLLLGGPEERERNAAIRDAAAGRVRLFDAGVEHPLLEFAALVDRVDLLVTSDSLALHVAIARRRPVVAFFAPTSAAEIELYGRGEKVVSTAPDVCSYRPDADTSTLTVERLADAVERTLAAADVRR
jgi:heptosyltransferase-2